MTSVPDRPRELRVNGRAVVSALSGAALSADLSPRPYLHPVRTLGGVTVTDAMPHDHPWHLGVSVGIPDVDGVNFWGGPTFVEGRGYLASNDHGRIDIVDENVADTSLQLTTNWRAVDDELLISEVRTVSVKSHVLGWELMWSTALTNATARPLRLASPESNGRPGAGYGGFFWRFARSGESTVVADRHTGEDAVNGASAPWALWCAERPRFSVAITPVGAAAAQWFVRSREYPGLGVQIAAPHSRLLDPGEVLRIAHRSLISDELIGCADVGTWAAQ